MTPRSIGRTANPRRARWLALVPSLAFVTLVACDPGWTVTVTNSRETAAFLRLYDDGIRGGNVYVLPRPGRTSSMNGIGAVVGWSRLQVLDEQCGVLGEARISSTSNVTLAIDQAGVIVDVTRADPAHPLMQDTFKCPGP